MRHVIALLLLLVLAGCQAQEQLSPAEKAALERAQCQALAIEQSGFDPLTAEEPPRTISITVRSGCRSVIASATVIPMRGESGATRTSVTYSAGRSGRVVVTVRRVGTTTGPAATR